VAFKGDRGCQELELTLIMAIHRLVLLSMANWWQRQKKSAFAGLNTGPGFLPSRFVIALEMCVFGELLTVTFCLLSSYTVDDLCRIVRCA